MPHEGAHRSVHRVGVEGGAAVEVPRQQIAVVAQAEREVAALVGDHLQGCG